MLHPVVARASASRRLLGSFCRTTASYKKPPMKKKQERSQKLKRELPLETCVRLVKACTLAPFDESVDISFHLSVDPRRPNQQVRGVAQLPHGVGKRPVLAVFAKGAKAEEATKAGADYVGGEEIVEMVKAGDIPFTRCLATPDMMPMVSKVARILGPKGLMPNLKAGTISPEIGKLVKDALQGQVAFRCERNSTLATPIGRMYFSDAMLLENIHTLVKTIQKARPSGAPAGVPFIKGVVVNSSKGSAFRVDLDLPPFVEPKQ
jgi:large subunit ribosomal protein L1